MRFRANRSGINSLMRTPGSGRAVRETAERIASAAGAGGGDFRTDSALGQRRWRAAVIGDYRRMRAAERTRRALLRGLDGGAG